jgi:GcrA cell cycle regulator
LQAESNHGTVLPLKEFGAAAGREILEQIDRGHALRLLRLGKHGRPTAPPMPGLFYREAIAMNSALQTWTIERVDQLRRYVEAGFSCGQIAGEIGLSRNAVIGKIHRLGLWRGTDSTPRARTQRRRPAVLSQRRALAAAYASASTVDAEAAIDSAKRCSLFELTEGKCRWPLSDPGAKDFCFCGNDAVGGLSYCAGHARLAYRSAAR